MDQRTRFVTLFSRKHGSMSTLLTGLVAQAVLLSFLR